jgi:hypothetical protein
MVHHESDFVFARKTKVLTLQPARRAVSSSGPRRPLPPAYASYQQRVARVLMHRISSAWQGCLKC